MHLENISRGGYLAAREWIVGNFATARKTNVAKDIAMGTVDTEILISISTVSGFAMRKEQIIYMAVLPSYMIGGNILPSMIISIGSLISRGVGGFVADGIS